jgi:hypothetical protein
MKYIHTTGDCIKRDKGKGTCRSVSQDGSRFPIVTALTRLEHQSMDMSINGQNYFNVYVI